jgi:hypothetical protein
MSDSKNLAVWTGIGVISALIPKLVQAEPPVSDILFQGFRTELIQEEEGHNTTTRQSDGAQAYDFRHYPLVGVDPDIDGEYQIDWTWTNYLDGVQVFSSPLITNIFTALEGGVPVTLELTDNRADNNRGGSIAFGDPDGLFDGVWHTVETELSLTLTSPSGQTASLNTGLVTLGVFQSVAALGLTFEGFNVVQYNP